MPIDTSMYRQLGQIGIPSLMESRKGAAQLRSLGQKERLGEMQIEEAERTANMQKASALGSALDSMKGLDPAQRAQTYGQMRSQLIEQGIASEETLPPDYDEGFYSTMLNRYHQTKDYMDKELQTAKIQKIKAETLEARAKAKKPEGEKAKMPKSTQFQAATYGHRVQQAGKTLDDLYEKEDYDPTSVGAYFQREWVPEFAMSEDAKSHAQAERNFVNAILRRESGAAIAESEFESAEKQYFPREGDSPKVVAQKRKNRQLALSGLKSEAGKAWGEVGKEFEQVTETEGPLKEPPKEEPGAPPNTAFADGGGPTKKDLEAVKWLRDNPDHPKAEEVRARLGTKGLGGKGLGARLRGI